MPRRRTLLAAPLFLAGATERHALAQPVFPDRPVRIVVGFTPGGATDIAVRAFAPRMGELLGQPIVVENRAGAGGNIAMEAVVRAPADGHTLLLGTIGTLVVNPITTRMGFDPVEEFLPVGIAVEAFNILVVPADRPWRDLADLLAAARAAPGRLSWGYSGIGTTGHLAGTLLDRMAAIDTIGVSYRGGAPLATDLLAGRIDYAFSTAPPALPHVAAGRLRAIAVPTAGRAALLPQVPTVAEGGVTGFDVQSWYALLAPRGTPAPVIARLNAALQGALTDPETVATLLRNGLEPMPGPAEALARGWEAERSKWQPMIRAMGIRPE
ncbi:Bug family tripartite tricarboxylate transporter substrate binding protein [Humitalea sp. 24SJ18S-53]|uniref:Bug family tripartite tricarboxylate transporter substrate binding protein n=1 Tax=Humitalea sp. 24SJ18S-53 TaxID=3422307 RepID=UPI003D67D7CE